MAILPMMGSDGGAVAFGGGGGSGGTPPATWDPCNGTEANGGPSGPTDPPPECATTSDCPVGKQCISGSCDGGTRFPLAAISNSPLMALEAYIDPAGDSDCAAQPFNGGDGFCAYGNVVVDYNCTSSDSLVCDICDAIMGLDVIKDLLSGLIIDEVGPVIEDMLTDVLNDTMGMPIDFNMIFSGQPFTKTDICAFRDTQATTPACSHGSRGKGGSCACDDIDHSASAYTTLKGNYATGGLGMLNYQDWNDSSGSSFYHPWKGTYPGTIDEYEDTDYAVARNIGGWVDLDGSQTESPPYDIGAYLTSIFNYSGNNGISLVGDLAMSAHNDFLTSPSTAYSSNTYSCFNGNIWQDVTGPDNTPGSRRNASSPSWQGLDNFGGTAQHIILGTSQYVLEEYIYALLTSGLLCIVVDDNLLSGLGDLLKVSNMTAVIPALSAAVSAGKIDGSSTVQALFRPAGTPTVRVLGQRNISSAGGEWPGGDCIPDDGLNSHDNAELEIFTSGAPCNTGGNNAYDLMMAFPHFKVEFWVDETALGSGTKTKIFETDIDIVMTMAIEYTQTGNTTLFNGTRTFSRFLEVLLDVWMGCSGEIVLSGTGVAPGTGIGWSKLVKIRTPLVTVLLPTEVVLYRV